MSLAETLKTQSLATAARAVEAGARPWQGQARERLATLSFPERRTERWKYTSLQPLADGHLAALAAGAPATRPLPDFGAACVLHVHNGTVAPLPALPPGVSAELASEGDAPAVLQGQDVFTVFNAALARDVLRLRVARDVRVAAPLHLVISASSADPATAPARIELTLEPGAECSLIEHYLGDGPVLTSAVVRIDAGENSQLVHYRLQDDDVDALHVGRVEIDVQAHARVRSFQLMQGNRLRRNEVQGRLLGAGADLSLRGVFLGFGRTHTDNQIGIEHCVPRCTSSQIYRGIIGDRARGVFNGRIHIHPGAAGTDAWLNNANLLLSREAEIDTKPELEIYNDDVKCAHGTTVGQLDPQHLFYLRSRGVAEAEARRMLAVGFVNALLREMPHEAVAQWAGDWLGKTL